MGLLDNLARRLGYQRAATKPPGRRDAYAGVYGGGGSAGFAGAAVSRLTANMATYSGAINADLDAAITVLRARARALCANSEHGRRFLSLVATNVVGPAGPVLQMRARTTPAARGNADRQPPLDKTANDAIERHYARWQRTADLAGRMTYSQLLRVAVKAVARDGEALLRIVRRRDLPYGIAVQLLEADRLDDMLNGALPGGRTVRQGVEIDGTGRALAYYIKTAHPGDRYAGQAAQTERVPADQVIHAFLPERAEQVRGYTWLHAVIFRSAQLADFNDAAVIAAKVGASKIAALERKADDDGAPDLAASMADSQTTTGAGAPGNLQMHVEAGELFELPPGYALNSWDPQYPHENYESFLKAAMRGIAAGLDVAAHNISGDMTDVNYSSARIAELAEREVWIALQDWFIDTVAARVFQEWLASALLRGDVTFEQSGKALPAEKLGKFADAARFQGRRWRWVDPAKDIAAQRDAVALGITSRTRIAAEQGDDLQDILDELQAEREAMQKAGLSAAVQAGAAAPGAADQLDAGASLPPPRQPARQRQPARPRAASPA